MGLDGVTLATLEKQLVDATDRDELKAPLQSVAKRAADGNEQAVELLLAIIDERQLAHPAIARQLFNPEDRADVAQDVLIAVTRSIGTFRGDANILSWVYKIATNCALGFVRRRQDATSIGGNVTQNEALPSSAQRFSSMVANNDVIQAAIANLPDRYHDAVVLRDVRQLPYAEVADRLGLNLNTTRARIARGRGLVAEELKEQIPDLAP